MPNRRRHLGLLLALCLASPGAILGAEAAAGAGDRVARLARRLGAADFSQRQQAERDILQVGPSALPALQQAVSSAGLERRRRLERIINVLSRQRREQALSQLSRRDEPADPQLLTTWSAFFKLIGNGDESRKLFVEMARYEPWVVDAVAGSPDELRRDFERRAADINLQRMQRQQTTRSIATVAALMFAALQPDCFPSSSAVTCINACIQEGPCLKLMQQTDRSQPLERLISVWVANPTATPAHQRLQLAAKFGLEEGTDVALQIIEQHLPGPHLQQAILYLAKAGNASHIHPLELLLDDNTNLQQRRHHSVTTFSCRVRDVALVALLHLTGQDPEAYGFSVLRKDPNYIYRTGTIGFETDDERKAAFAKWRRWSAANLKQVQPVVEQAAVGFST